MVQTEKMIVAGCLFDDDFDVGETVSELRRERFNRISDKPLELGRAIALRADGRAPRSADAFASDFGRSP